MFFSLFGFHYAFSQLYLGITACGYFCFVKIFSFDISLHTHDSFILCCAHIAYHFTINKWQREFAISENYETKQIGKIKEQMIQHIMAAVGMTNHTVW